MLVENHQPDIACRDNLNINWIRVACLWFFHKGIRSLLSFYLGLMGLAKLFKTSKRFSEVEGFDILITGTFYSENWITTHLRPLALSKHCDRIRMVSTSKVPDMVKVKGIYPPKWVVRIIGATPARLLTFSWIAIKTKPAMIGGFHLLINGLIASLLARMLGVYSLYFCGGGPREVLGGGFLTENSLFRMLKTPDLIVEGQLIDAVKEIDLIITMGKGAKNFFREHNVKSKIHVVPGGFDGTRFSVSQKPPTKDLILVGRLSEVKRVDVFLKALSILKIDMPEITATIVGDGILRASLETLSQELGVDKNVDFVGHQDEVKPWLMQSKLFILTSDAEGLSQAMMEGMLCGLPVVVPRVGDLGDLVENGCNGYLVSDRTPKGFAVSCVDILTNPGRLAIFGKRARYSAEKYEIANVTRTWNNILSNQNIRNGV